MYNLPGISNILKIALFATGCAGVVAEFVLSTLATYLIGNAIIQWTLVMSFMLFAMGIGSRISRVFHERLLDIFISVEFTLSIICAGSTVFAYGIAAYTDYTDLIIYIIAIVIGTLIGLEIPLVTRINESYEELRTNISGVMEKDYFGALFGGLLFAFFALPHFGLTYTPVILGFINFLVASLLLWGFFPLVSGKKGLVLFFTGTVLFLVLLVFFAKPVIMYGEQKKYRDVVIYSVQTPYQKIVITKWKEFYWLFINGQEQFSTYDEEKYHEPLVHPAMKVSSDPSKVLIIGGGDGMALREVFKHPAVRSVTLVDLDPAMTKLAKTHPVLSGTNQGSMNDSRLRVINMDAARFLRDSSEMFGVILIDLPDPDTIDLMHVYSDEFYRSLRHHLVRGGVMTTQATSPYFTKKAFQCLMKTIRHAGFSILPYHNQVPTMGEWGWIMGVKQEDMDENGLKHLITRIEYRDIETRFLNRDAVISMIHFGKGVIDDQYMESININTRLNPVLYRYYQEGNWGVY